MASKKLQATITIGGAVASSLASAFGAVKNQTGQIGDAVSELERRHKQLNDVIKQQERLGASGSALKVQYAQQELAMLDKQIAKLKQVGDAIKRNDDAIQANLSRRAELRGQMIDAVALGAVVAAPIRTAIAFESSMADVNKVVDFDTADQFRAMSNEIVRMSTVLPMAAEDIAQIVAAGGQSGLARDELTAFAESAVKVGVAFNMTAEEAGQMMAEMRSAFRMSQDEVNELADKMNLLANTTAASESRIASVVRRVGPLGEVAGTASGSIAALGATLISMGVAEEVAATGIQNLMLALVAGESATKKQQEAFAKLGMDSVAIAKGMQKDAEGTILAIMQQVKTLNDYEQAAVLQQIFGKESIKSIAPLLNNLEALAENFDKVSDATRYAGAVEAEYAARAATTENNLQLLRNRIASVGIAIGSALLPALNDTLRVIGPIISKVAEFAEANPQLTRAVVGTAVALTSLKLATLGSAYAFTFIKGGALTAIGVFHKLRAAMVLASMHLPAVVTAIRAVGVALMTNPVGAIIGGIAMAGFMIYRHWDGVKAFMVGTFQGMRGGLEPLVQTFREFWDSLAPVRDMFGSLGGVLKTAWEWFKGLIGPVEYSADELGKAGEAGKTFGEYLAAGINFVLTPLQLLIQGITWVNNNIGAVLDKAVAFKEAVGGKIDGAMDRVGSAWSGAKSFFGFGDDEPAAAAGTDSLPQPTLATGRGGAGTYTDQSQTTIQVVQQPGQSTRELAREITRLQEQERAARQRSVMADGAMAQ